MTEEGQAEQAAAPGGLREQYRRQMLASFGGWSGTVVTAVPTVVFVAVNAGAGLRWAIVAAVGSAFLLAGYRLARHQPVQQALTGLVGVVIASLIAARTGQARGYFLLGIWSSFLYAAVFAASVVVRRPLVGLLWEFLDPSPGDPPRDEPLPGDQQRPAPDDRQRPAPEPWYRRRTLLRAYLLATLAGVVLFTARGVVQLTLFQHDATGWLAFARIAMGYPLYIAAVGYAVWVVRRARHRLVRA